MTGPLVSFILGTFNRREAVLDTLARLEECGLARSEYEVFVVDNASTDGTERAIADRFAAVQVIPLKQNRGSTAKNVAIPLAKGRYVMFLDDDSYPQPRAVVRMMHHFRADDRLGAAGFNIVLPGGGRECSAYPNVFIGCGVAFRREALREVGGLDESLFMQAEEYDLSLRLLDANWRVKTFDDLYVVHLKTPTARRPSRTTRLDVRNNLVIAYRYFPERWLVPFMVSWMKRYWAIAKSKGHRLAFVRGVIEGATRCMSHENRLPIREEAFEQFARVEELKIAMAAAKDQLDLRRVLFVDYGKNFLAYVLAAEACGLTIVAVADSNLSGVANKAEGVPIVDDESARLLSFDAVVVSNSSPVHASARRDQWNHWTERPVINLLALKDAQLTSVAV